MSSPSALERPSPARRPSRPDRIQFYRLEGLRDPPPAPPPRERWALLVRVAARLRARAARDRA